MTPNGNLPVIATLRETPLFVPLSMLELQSLADRASVGTYASGELLFSEGGQ